MSSVPCGSSDFGNAIQGYLRLLHIHHAPYAGQACGMRDPPNTKPRPPSGVGALTPDRGAVTACYFWPTGSVGHRLDQGLDPERRELVRVLVRPIGLEPITFGSGVTR